MRNQRGRFEVFVLRPVWLAILGAAVFCLVSALWWWLAGAMVAAFWAGAIGAKLHPLQSASTLAKGPLNNPTARIEDLLPSRLQGRLLQRASAEVAMLVAAICAFLLIGVLGWRWYFAIPLVWLVVFVLYGALRTSFRQASERDDSSAGDMD